MRTAAGYWATREWVRRPLQIQNQIFDFTSSHVILKDIRIFRIKKPDISGASWFFARVVTEKALTRGQL